MAPGERREASEERETDPGPAAAPRSPRPLFSEPAVRIAGLFLLLVGLVHLITYAAIAVVGSSFAARSSMHLEREVARFRKQITADEPRLDAEAAHVAGAIVARPGASRDGPFRIISQGHAPNCAIRLFAPTADLVA